MRKLASKVVSLALAAVIALTGVPMTAHAEGDPYVSDHKFYMSYKMGTGSYTTTSSYIGNMKKNDKIKNVKVSNKNLAELNYVEYCKYNSSYSYEYPDKTQNHNSQYTDYYAYISLKVKKVGKFKVSFKIGSKSYSSQYEIMKYTNPVDTMKITNIDGGKNLASKTKDSNSISGLNIKKNASNGKIEVKAKKGWKITSIRYRNEKKAYTVEQGYTNNGTYGVAKASLNVGAMSKDDNGYVDVSYVDANGIGMSCYYYFSAASNN